jgi:hypothetical protein
MHLESLCGVPRRESRVELLDELVRWDGCSAVDEQNRQQSLLLRAERNQPTVALDLKTTEDPYVHLLV